MKEQVGIKLLIPIILFFLLVNLQCPDPPITATKHFNTQFSFRFGPSDVKTVSKPFNFFFGHRTDSVTLNYNSSADTIYPVIVLDGNRDTISNLHQANENGTITTRGNVCSVEISDYRDHINTHNFLFGGITLHYTSNRISVPEIDLMSAKVKSYPLTLNEPVNLFFDDADTTLNYFLTVRGVKDKIIDLMVEGTAKILVGDQYTGFVLGEENAIDVLSGDDMNFTTYRPVNPGRDTLYFTVKPVQGKTHQVKFCVNENSELLKLNFHFRGNLSRFNLSNEDDLRNEMTDLLNEANRSLYGSTQGRVRIEDADIFVGGLPQLPEVIPGEYPRLPVKPDIAIDYFEYPTDRWRSHALMWTNPRGEFIRGILIELDGDWWNRRDGRTIAHELFHYRYLIPDEYEETDNFRAFPPESNFTDHCPGCIMCESAANLCIPASHNAANSDFLRDHVSCWEILAPQLNVPVPGKTTPAIIGLVHTFRFPTNISVTVAPTPPAIRIPELPR